METSNLPLSPELAGRLEMMAEAERANEYLYVALDIGQQMLQSGAEVSRVEDSIKRLCFSFGAERADVLTITASIVVTVYSHKFGTLTQTRRIPGMKYDLNRLELLNQLCRLVCSDHFEAADIRTALDEIMAVPQYSFGVQVFTYALISASFSLFFGGSALDAAASGLIGIVLKFLDKFIARMDASPFLSAMLCSCLGGLLAGLAVHAGLGESVDMISIGNIMLLIPGIALTNSLRDMFSGNTISGLMRFIEAILLALTIACGFALAAGVF